MIQVSPFETLDLHHSLHQNGAMRHPYTLFKRKTSKVWYFYYYEGHTRKAASTGTTRKYEAEQYAESFLRLGKYQDITFSEYAKDFFLWDSCPWIKRQHAKGRPFSQATAFHRRGHLKNYLFPKFRNYTLSSLNRVQIEKWLIDLPIGNGAKNAIMCTLRIILREAEAENLISLNPLDKMEPMGKTCRPRGIFTREELKAMFPEERNELIELWGSMEIAVLFYILSITGIRQGEGRALQWKDVLWEGGLVVSKSVKYDNSVGSTKTNSMRVVPLTSRGLNLLKQWREESPYREEDDFIFFGTQGDKVMGSQTINRPFHRMLEVVPIEGNGRILVIHSFRHTFNTMMKRVLPLTTLQAITGHTTEEMSEHYDHPTADDLFNTVKGSKEIIEGVLK